MGSDRITSKDVILMLGGSIAGAVIPGVIGWYTGSFDVVLSFASAKPLESALWTLLFLSLGALAGQLVRGRSANKELDEKDAEIARLMDDNLALKKQLDVQKVPGAVTALQAMAEAASRATDHSFLDDRTHLRQLRTIAGEWTDSDEETTAWEDAIEALSEPSAQDVDKAFSGITRAEARVLLDYADGRQLNHSKFDSNVKSLLEKRVLRVIGRDDADAPLPGDDLGVSAKWTKLLNDHRDEFVKYFGLEPEK